MPSRVERRILIDFSPKRQPPRTPPFRNLSARRPGAMAPPWMRMLRGDREQAWRAPSTLSLGPSFGPPAAVRRSVMCGPCGRGPRPKPRAMSDFAFPGARRRPPAFPGGTNRRTIGRPSSTPIASCPPMPWDRRAVLWARDLGDRIGRCKFDRGLSRRSLTALGRGISASPRRWWHDSGTPQPDPRDLYEAGRQSPRPPVSFQRGVTVSTAHVQGARVARSADGFSRCGGRPAINVGANRVPRRPPAKREHKRELVSPSVGRHS